jgi:hypothetical protein
VSSGLLLQSKGGLSFPSLQLPKGCQ